MNVDWRNTFEIMMCAAICDGAGAGICDVAPSTVQLCLIVEYSSSRLLSVSRKGQAS